MKQKKKALPTLLLGLLLCFTSCSNGQGSASYYTLDYSKYDYSVYCGLSDFKGLELYAWKNTLGIYECGLLSGTDRLKSVDEIKYLQQNHPCPLNTMSEILKSYPEYKDFTFVAIVSTPPMEEELTHSIPDPIYEDDLAYLSYQLGLSDATKEEYEKANLKTTWRENYLLTIDKRNLFTDFSSQHNLIGMTYTELKQYLGNPTMEEKIVLETYPPMFGGYIAHYELFKDEENHKTEEVIFTIDSTNKVESFEKQ